MRIAAIDVGTNSIHMIVVQVRPDLSFEVIDREKDMIRLGAGGLDGRSLTETAMLAARQTLSRYRRLADSHGVDEIVATATSAVREADNGGDLLAAVLRETGVQVRVISGLEEARLIHLAASYGVDFGDASVVVDIGGGSVEITLGPSGRPVLARSFKLGVIRLTERFVRSDPLSGRDERRLVRAIRRETGAYLDDIATRGYLRVIGTSGTILSLGALAATDAGDDVPEERRNLRVSARAFHRLRKRITGLSLGARLKLGGLEPKRADIAVAGAVLFDTILERLGAEEFTMCDLALREGLVLDYINRNVAHIRQTETYPDVRRRSVIELAERFRYAPEHTRQVARLSLALFDQTRPAHGLSDREREWLEYAALLHDIGMLINYERHHRHSYYLIKNGDLRGFEPDEIETVALVARYHRRGTPKKSHAGYQSLRGAQRATVKWLGALLRLAEGLDRSHAQVVSGIKLSEQGDTWLLHVRAAGDAELELWAAQHHIAPLEALLKHPIRFEVTGHAEPAKGTYGEHPDNAPHVSGQALRRRRHRRVRQDDATRPARQVAAGGRPPRVRDRVELVGARESGHKGGKEEGRAHADDVQPASRDGLRRPAAVQRHPASQGRDDRAG
jgi:exopolyphosphatase/guanosine-5'-triphosphate,3'-diphosphate pyrophosphatase